ncbi:hypothetical protein ACRASX_15125 [Flavobacterium sp. TMP13]|uniref:hypothetical protein n=1 Tax=Flavobacterium sp. TMP13 TaxID=3425950 RepID=UPI003D77B133
MKNKNFKIIFYFGLLFCLLAITYFYFFSKSVQIEVYNKTNFDIDSLKIENKYYEIKKRKSIIINCRKLLIQNSLPLETPKAIIKNMQRDTLIFPVCGTEVEEIKSGKYKFDLEAEIGKDYYKLNWVEHTQQ